MMGFVPLGILHRPVPSGTRTLRTHPMVFADGMVHENRSTSTRPRFSVPRD